MTEGAALDGSAVERLLALDQDDERADYLSAHGVLDRAGLSSLLDTAMQFAREDPGKARRLAEICAAAAAAAGAPEIAPRATYARAQTHAINGEFQKALELIETAKREFDAIGDRLSGMRTNLGRMHVLNELGRHEEALRWGEDTLAEIASLEGESAPTAEMITALAQMNMGVCLETMGRYQEALLVYDRAEARFSEMGMPDRLGDVHNNRGIVLVHLGRVREALEAFESALLIWRAEGLTLLEAQTLSNIGEAHLALGDYTDSLNVYEAARGLFEGVDAEAEHSILLRKTADAYLALNLYPEAAGTYRRAVEMLTQAGMADQQARAFWGLGAALTGLGRLEEARVSLERAADLFRGAGNVPMLAAATLELSALAAEGGDRHGGLALAAEALGMVDARRWPVETLNANLRLAALDPLDFESVEEHLAAAGRIAAGLNLPVARARVNTRLGRLRKMQRRVSEAEQALEAALEDIENLRGRLAHEATRTSFLHDKGTVYDDLIAIRLARAQPGDAWAAFDIAERAKSRTLSDLMAGIVSQRSLQEGGDALSNQIRGLQAELGAVYNRYFDPESTGPRSEDLPRRAAALEAEISRLRLQAAGRLATDPFEQPLALRDLRSELAGAGPLLAYHLLDDEVVAFFVDGETNTAVRGFAPVEKIRGLVTRLTAQWDRFRAGEAFVQRNLPTLERSAERALEAIFSACFAPVAEAWSQRPGGWPETLTIVPHGLLHQVPFHALFDGETYLVDRLEIAYAPSAAVHVLSERRARNAPSRALVAGAADTLIPRVEAEAVAVADLLGKAGLEQELLLGARATSAQVRTSAGGADLIHLACHGLFRGDNPLFSALKLSDGWLTAVDVMEFELEAPVVVLSACESGRGRIVQGEEVLGLPRAFMGAGAAAVVVSLWLAEDAAAEALMSAWYRGLGAGANRAAALQAAQRAVRESHPHPYYWAPFVLIGQR